MMMMRVAVAWGLACWQTKAFERMRSQVDLHADFGLSAGAALRSWRLWCFATLAPACHGANYIQPRSCHDFHHEHCWRCQLCIIWGNGHHCSSCNWKCCCSSARVAARGCGGCCWCNRGRSGCGGGVVGMATWWYAADQIWRGRVCFGPRCFRPCGLAHRHSRPQIRGENCFTPRHAALPSTAPPGDRKANPRALSTLSLHSPILLSRPHAWADDVCHGGIKGPHRHLSAGEPLRLRRTSAIARSMCCLGSWIYPWQEVDLPRFKTKKLASQQSRRL